MVVRRLQATAVRTEADRQKLSTRRLRPCTSYPCLRRPRSPLPFGYAAGVLACQEVAGPPDLVTTVNRLGVVGVASRSSPQVRAAGWRAEVEDGQTPGHPKGAGGRRSPSSGLQRDCSGGRTRHPHEGRPRARVEGQDRTGRVLAVPDQHGPGDVVRHLNAVALGGAAAALPPVGFSCVH